MKGFEAFLSDQSGTVPHSGQKGILTEWFPFSDLELSSGNLAFFDPAFPPDDSTMGTVIELPPGQFKLEARGIAFGADRRVAAVRCILQDVNVAKISKGEPIGEVGVDTGRIGVGDLSLLSAVLENLDGDVYEDLLTSKDAGAFIIKLDPNTPLAIFSAGFGDGAYPVSSLLNGNDLIGAEIDLISADKSYPFGTPEPKVGSHGNLKDEKLQFLNDLLEKLASSTNGLRSPKETLMAAVHEMQKEKLGALRDQGGEFKTHLLTQRKKAPIVSLRVLSHKPDPIESVRFSSQKAAFESFGYIFAGGYTFEKIPNYSVIVLTHPEDGTFVGINLHGADEIICTIEAHYPDGSNFSLRDTPLKPGITPPPWHYVQCVPTGTPSELVQRFRSARPPGQKFITPADVPYLLEDSFQLVQQWRIARGGWNREEVAAQLKLTDTPETSDRITQASMDAREKWLFAWLKTEQPEVAKQFEQDFLVIHDELPDYILQMYWVMGTGASISFKDLLENATPIEAFKKLNLAKGAPFQLLAQKTTGFIADFYVAV